MPDEDADRLLPDREHYRELAGGIRRVAQPARFPFARKQLIRLAASFEYRARHLSLRGCAPVSSERHSASSQWVCVGLLSLLSLLPGQDMVRTGFPGPLEHFAAYAGSGAVPPGSRLEHHPGWSRDRSS
jgi:hypothetical protein